LTMSFQAHSCTRQQSGASAPSRETDHRIANSLSMIASLVRLRAKGEAGDDPRDFLIEIASRIEIVAQLHRLLSQSGTEAVRLSSYLREICELLARALAPGRATFSVNCCPEQIVPAALALPLGLMMAELCSNSLKYAHPTGLPVKIAIACDRSAEGGLRIVYEDDGVGFPEEFDVEHDGHLGMQFIRGLSVQLNGRHGWLSDPLGVRFEISLPVTVESEATEAGE